MIMTRSTTTTSYCVAYLGTRFSRRTMEADGFHPAPFAALARGEIPIEAFR